MTQKRFLIIFILIIISTGVVFFGYAMLKTQDKVEELPFTNEQKRDISSQISSDPPSQENPAPLCDLNQDGSCDLTDFQLLQSSLGKCIQDFSAPADFLADVDGDGCLADNDEHILFSDTLVAIGDVIVQLQDIVDNNPGTPLADKIEDALAKTRTAFNELTKDPSDNQAGVGNTEGAVGDLEAAVKDGLLDSTQGIDLMDRLTEVARELAVDALDAAIAQGGKQDEINNTQQALAEGDTLRASGAFKDAVNKYKDALAKAESALE